MFAHRVATKITLNGSRNLYKILFSRELPRLELSSQLIFGLLMLKPRAVISIDNEVRHFATQFTKYLNLVNTWVDCTYFRFLTEIDVQRGGE